MNIAICDDEKAIREQINELIVKEKPDVCPKLYETGDGLLAAGKQFDIVFPDIQMEGTDGIETSRKLWERDEDTILIFITGIREYVFEAFDVAAFHYLLKPVEEDKFREVFRRAERELEKRKKQQRETIEAYASMNEMEAQLGEGFYRCHRGYLVNMAYVAEYDNGSITLNNGEYVCLAKEKYGEFVKAYMRYLRNGVNADS